MYSSHLKPLLSLQQTLNVGFANLICSAIILSTPFFFNSCKEECVSARYVNIIAIIQYWGYLIMRKFCDFNFTDNQTCFFKSFFAWFYIEIYCFCQTCCWYKSNSLSFNSSLEKSINNFATLAKDEHKNNRFIYISIELNKDANIAAKMTALCQHV